MTGTIKFELEFEVDNNWEDAHETINHIKSIVKHELTQLEMSKKIGPGIIFEALYEDWNDLTFKTDQDRYEDHLMATDPRV
tara:strand:- start:272 stop:514 length:243 start_codon:yes stop_codon:yes gene_type:complete